MSGEVLGYDDVHWHCFGFCIQFHFRHYVLLIMFNLHPQKYTDTN